MSDTTNYETPRAHLTRLQRRDRVLEHERRLNQGALSQDPPTDRAAYTAWRDQILQTFTEPEQQRQDENQETTDAPEQQPLLSASETESRTLAEMFQLVEGSYEDANAGNRYTLSPENIRRIDNPQQYIFAPQQPFIILDSADAEGIRWHANDTVVPYAYNNPGETPLIDSTIIRYANGERITAGDSGLFALCAAATPNHEDQARLFTHLANAIVTIHEDNTILQAEWLMAQTTDQQKETGSVRSSFDIFLANDYELTPNGQSELRRAEERLILNDKGEFIETEFPTRCQTMVEGLRTALAAGRLEPYHLRQLEFLSHSIDIASMFGDLQNTSPKPTPTPAAEPPPGTPPDAPTEPKFLKRLAITTKNAVNRAAPSVATAGLIAAGVADVIAAKHTPNLGLTKAAEILSLPLLVNGTLLAARKSYDKFRARRASRPASATTSPDATTPQPDPAAEIDPGSKDGEVLTRVSLDIKNPAGLPTTEPPQHPSEPLDTDSGSAEPVVPPASDESATPVPPSEAMPEVDLAPEPPTPAVLPANEGVKPTGEPLILDSPDTLLLNLNEGLSSGGRERSVVVHPEILAEFLQQSDGAHELLRGGEISSISIQNGSLHISGDIRFDYKGKPIRLTQASFRVDNDGRIIIDHDYPPEFMFGRARDSFRQLLKFPSSPSNNDLAKYLSTLIDGRMRSVLRDRMLDKDNRITWNIDRFSFNNDGTVSVGFKNKNFDGYHPSLH